MEEIIKDACIRDLRLYAAQQIRMARLARRMSQKELSEVTGITAAAICKLERGESDIRLSTLALIRSALALNITIDKL